MASSERPASRSGGGGGDPLAQLHPAQLREMRESFQTMDRDNDGIVTADDVKEMLNETGARHFSPPPSHTTIIPTSAS